MAKPELVGLQYKSYCASLGEFKAEGSMNVGTLSSYVFGGSLGAFIGLWITRKTMNVRETADGIVTDVDVFGSLQFTAEGLIAHIVVIVFCAVVGAVIARLFRKVRRGR